MPSHREKPPRLSQVYQRYDPPLYFVTITTWRRQQLLDNDRVHTAFVLNAGKQSLLRLAIGRYVLMPDHAHLFVRIGSGQSLSKCIKHLKEAVTKSLRATDPGLRVWQPGFFDHLLRNRESYAKKWEYVRMNPVRAALVENAEDWPYQGEIVRIDRV